MTSRAFRHLQRLSDQGVRKIAYFHCDHFEPWRSGVTNKHARELEVFQKQARNNPFSEKMSLFYKPQVSYSFYKEGVPNDVAHVSGEPIGFPALTDEQCSIAKSAMSAVAADGHEIQIHIHHEGYTRSSVNHHPDVKAWLDENGSAESDSARLRVAIDRHLDQARHDTGASLKDWFFVHGNWALNGSDHSICQINDEMQILQSMGCLGDFTFPAGRRRVDPDILLEPYTCHPVTLSKGYNLPDSDPKPLDSTQARETGRFFIWHSAQRHPTLSLDLYSQPVRALFESPLAVAEGWILGAPAYGDTLYIKTYSHSMNKAYFDAMDNPIIPHNDPQVLIAFDHLRRLADITGLEVEFVTVSNVYQRLMQGPALVKHGKIHAAQSSSDDVKTKETPLLKRIFNRISGADTTPAGPISVATLDQSAVTTMSERIAKLGDTDSGAYGFYKVRVERSEMITRYERELVEKVFDRDPDISEVHDIGAGLGSVALAVAGAGVRAVMLEYDRRRVAAAEAIIAKIEKTWPEIKGRLSIEQGAFPEVAPARNKRAGKFVGIATNVMGTLPSEIEDKMIEGLTKYDAVYVDLQRFCTSRKTKVEIDSLLTRMSDAGLTSQELLVDYGDYGHYYRLAKG